eukprot:m.1002333 g.1002333  ORF g.1002333 m.1002333 type:complete len:487 (-) comp24036_c0_seq4:1158-2618(-)
MQCGVAGSTTRPWCSRFTRCILHYGQFWQVYSSNLFVDSGDAIYWSVCLQDTPTSSVQGEQPESSESEPFEHQPSPSSIVKVRGVRPPSSKAKEELKTLLLRMSDYVDATDFPVLRAKVEEKGTALWRQKCQTLAAWSAALIDTEYGDPYSTAYDKLCDAVCEYVVDSDYKRDLKRYKRNEFASQASTTKPNTPTAVTEAGDSSALVNDNMGVSVHHLEHVLLPRCRGKFADQASNGRLTNRDGWALDVDQGAIWHMVEYHVKPVTMRSQESYVNYLETLQHMIFENSQDENDNPINHVGRAHFMLSYSWSYRVTDVVSALVDWCERRQLDPKRTYVWICSLCVNQHALQSDEPAHSLAATFQGRVDTISTILPLMIPWTAPESLTRLWCLFEYHVAVNKNKRIELLFTPDDSRVLSGLLQLQGAAQPTVDGVLRGVQSANGAASKDADAAYIRAYIAGKGGERMLDEVVRGNLNGKFLSFSLGGN